MLRPRPARWFEIVAARDDATLVLEALARTGAVELEARSSIGLPPAFADVLPLLAQYADLAARYRAYWPAPEDCRPSAFPETPVAALQRSLTVVRAWAAESEPVIQALQRDEAERRELHLWQPLLETLGRRVLDPGLLAGAGPWLGVRLFVLPPGGEPDPAARVGAGALETLSCTLEVGGATHLLVAASPETLQALTQAVTALKGSAHAVPAWLGADAARNQAHLSTRLDELDREITELRHDARGAEPSPWAAVRAGRLQSSAMGAAERSRARGGRAAVLDHRLVERARRSKRWRRPFRKAVRARSRTTARHRPTRARRCCSAILAGPGRSRSSAAPSAFPPRARLIRARCSRSSCR